MPKFVVPKTGYATAVEGDMQLTVVKQEAMKLFNPSILGLGDLTAPSKRLEAMAAVFDLSGFTHFCKQIDPHLSVPAFLSRFLHWLMGELKSETIQKEYPEGTLLWQPLPLLVKFMGDGLLVLWDCDEMMPVNIRNTILSLSEICVHYQTRFLKTVEGIVTETPPVLRCGVARGAVFSVGNGSDYVGSCINMAARIQNLPGVSFAFNNRGVYLDAEYQAKWFTEKILVKKVSIRGIGENELIFILKEDFQKMSAEDQKTFRKP